MPDAVNGQADFGAGIYRGREAPENAVYDAVNCLIDNEGQLFRRGGSVYKSAYNTTTTVPVTNIKDAYLAVGRRTMFASGVLHVLDVDDAAPLEVAGAIDGPFYRVIVAGEFAAWRVEIARPHAIALYGGSLRPEGNGGYSLGTMNVTQGSATVTGVGTGWLGNAWPGDVLKVGGINRGIIKTVDLNTSMTLTKPYGGPTATGASYTLTASVYQLFPSDPSTTMAVGAAGTAPRLLVGIDNRVYFSEPGQPLNFPADQYHELPGNHYVTGIEGLGDTAMIFTSGGVWTISNLDFDALDDLGNVQHTVRQISDLVLWDEAGIVRWQDAIVAPCTDDAYLLTPAGVSQPITEAIRPLYRDYVRSGYRPGFATVFRGHYVLPIVTGRRDTPPSLVDTLVCRLDRGLAWTRWSGFGACQSYATRPGGEGQGPLLLGGAQRRIVDLTDVGDPSAANAADADGTVHPVAVETRDYPTPGRSRGSTTETLRVRYEATAAGTATLQSYFKRYQGGSWGALTALKGAAVSDGSDESVWRVGKRAPAIRFRMESAAAWSSFTLRTVEAPWRKAT